MNVSDLFFFFFSSRRRHTRYWRDWSSDVCSSDLRRGRARRPPPLTTYSTSKNVRLIANVPTGVGVGGKFAGKYYFQTTARSATYGTPDTVADGGLWVFDVSNPESPQVAAHLPLPVWQNEDVDLDRKSVV